MPIIRDEAKRNEIIGLLTTAYWMEIETVMNYIANAINLEGVRAEEIKKSLSADITAEIGHAQQFGRRIRELYGVVPGTSSSRPTSQAPAPRATPPTSSASSEGVIDAEQGAIDHYTKIIKSCNDVDYVTADMVTQILKDEEGHLREFEGFLKEYEKR